MPLLRRKPVLMVPVPKEVEEGLLPDDSQVYLIKDTGEIFLHYDDYVARMQFYLQTHFTCEYTGKTGLTYFEAAASEEHESQSTQFKFPDPLKPRVLQSAQFQNAGRLDKLVDLVFDRLVHRFYLGEKVIVDASRQNQRYFGLITKVTPPKEIRDLIVRAPAPKPAKEGGSNGASNGKAKAEDQDSASPLSDVDSPAPPPPTEAEVPYTPQELDSVAHCIGTNLELEKIEAERRDDYLSYTYSVSLLKDAQFSGSQVECHSAQLTRDRQSWSKVILKKYLKETLVRDAAVGSPWMVKPKLAQHFGIRTSQSEASKQRTAEYRQDQLARRRKVRKGEEDPDDSGGQGSSGPPPAKKSRVDIPQEQMALPALAYSYQLPPMMLNGAGPSGMPPQAMPGYPPAPGTAGYGTTGQSQPFQAPFLKHYECDFVTGVSIPIPMPGTSGTSGQNGSPAPGSLAHDTPPPGMAPNASSPHPGLHGLAPGQIKVEEGGSAPSAAPLLPAKLKPVKYPTEDLNLDPTTIFDGRVRRSKHAELPPLPKKPIPSRALPVPQEHFDVFMNIYNFLNTFGTALFISPFTLDDFCNALHHTDNDVRCTLLGEIHSVLTANIAYEGYRVAGTVQANANDPVPPLAASIDDEDGMTLEEREKYVQMALDYCRGWDRKARPKASDGRRGWELHLLGILTQRGGLETMPSLPSICRHLFTIDGEAKEEDEQEAEDEEVKGEESEQLEKTDQPQNGKDEMDVHEGDTVPDSQPPPPQDTKSEAKAEGQEDVLVKPDQPASTAAVAPAIEVSESSTSSRPALKKGWQYAETSVPDPEARYLTLSLGEKLDILEFLVEMNYLSRAVKNFIDDCELRLTEERKEKAEINKERKELLAERNLINNPNGAGAAAKDSGDAKDALGLPNDGAPNSSARNTPLLGVGADDPDATSVSIAPSERDESVIPDEAPSRGPSSSPLPELEEDEDGQSAVNDDAASSHVDGDDQDEEDEEEDGDEEAVESRAAVEETAEVGSDVDELASSNGSQSNAQPPSKPPSPINIVKSRSSSRKVGKGKRKVGKNTTTASSNGGGSASRAAKKVKKPKTPEERKKEITEELEMLAKKDDLYEREWRRFREVARTSPLGKDRFHNRYWWFDGIGPQSLIAANGRIIYGTGRIFVQGPSALDWQKACDEHGGEQVLFERMKKEEGHEQRLGIDEWAFFEEEKDFDQLLAWLNNKGVREQAFKANFVKWKKYIVQGAKSRQSSRSRVEGPAQSTASLVLIPR